MQKKCENGNPSQELYFDIKMHDNETFETRFG